MIRADKLFVFYVPTRYTLLFAYRCREKDAVHALLHQLHRSFRPRGATDVGLLIEWVRIAAVCSDVSLHVTAADVTGRLLQAESINLKVCGMVSAGYLLEACVSQVRLLHSHIIRCLEHPAPCVQYLTLKLLASSAGPHNVHKLCPILQKHVDTQSKKSILEQVLHRHAPDATWFVHSLVQLYTLASVTSLRVETAQKARVTLRQFAVETDVTQAAETLLEYAEASDDEGLILLTCEFLIDRNWLLVGQLWSRTRHFLSRVTTSGASSELFCNALRLLRTHITHGDDVSERLSWEKKFQEAMRTHEDWRLRLFSNELTLLEDSQIQEAVRLERYRGKELLSQSKHQDRRYQETELPLLNPDVIGAYVTHTMSRGAERPTSRRRNSRTLSQRVFQSTCIRSEYPQNRSLSDAELDLSLLAQSHKDVTRTRESKEEPPPRLYVGGRTWTKEGRTAKFS